MDFSAFKYYIVGSCTFIIVLICGELMFTAGYARRGRFFLRFLLSAAACLAASVLPTTMYYCVEYGVGNIIFTNVAIIFAYLIMFVFTVAGMKLCYNESVLRCLIAGVAGFMCQHMAYDVYSIINAASNLEYSLIVRLGRAGYWLGVFIQLACAAAVLGICYFAFARRANKFSADSTVRGNVIFIVISSLAVVLILNSIGDMFATVNLAVQIFVKCLLIACCVFMLIIYMNMFEAKEAKNELAIVLKLNEDEHAHFLKLKQDMELISVKCHDIKHFIAAAGAKGGVDLSELSEAVKIYDTAIKTGNEVIDTLLVERGLYCSAHGINLTVIADASQLSFISVNDMCSLFGNLIENAVEAAEKVQNKDNRLININIRPVAGQVFFCVENSYAEEPEIRGGMPVSSKKHEAGYHGYGIKSVKMIAEKYGGNFTLSAKDGVFRVSILFPVPPSEQK